MKRETKTGKTCNASNNMFLKDTCGFGSQCIPFFHMIVLWGTSAIRTYPAYYITIFFAITKVKIAPSILETC